ncbi:MAG: hypothetical protein ACLS28_15055 [Clostridium neonatale]
MEIRFLNQVSEYIDEYGIRKADVIYLKTSEDGIHNAMILTDIRAGKKYISSHSNDRINDEFNKDFLQEGETAVILKMN